MIWVMSVILGWLFFTTAQLFAQTPYWTLFFVRITYLFIAAVPVVWLIFTADYTGRDKGIRSKNIWLLAVIPALTILIAWIEPFNSLLWAYVFYIPQDNLLTFRAQHGYWFWVNAFYSYTLLAIGSFWIIQHYFYAIHCYRKQSLWIVIGSILPLAYNIVYVFQLIPGMEMDYSSLVAAFGILAFVIGISNYHLLDLAPVSRSMILDHMRDAVVVLDQKDRIIDLNLAGQQIFEISLQESLGRPLSDFQAVWNQLAPVWKSDNQEIEIIQQKNGDLKTYETRIIRFVEKDFRAHKTLLIFHDVTERVALLQSVQELARTDPLSELFNRRHFFERINQELERFRRYGTVFSLVMLDIDYFKTINDQCGHLAGDQVLTQVAEFCRQTMRTVDVLARYGGDEMIFLLPETGPQRALEAAERLREGVQRLEIMVNGEVMPVTISLGVTSLVPGEKISMEDLLSRVDRALYASKEQGRNRTTVWTASEDG